VRTARIRNNSNCACATSVAAVSCSSSAWLVVNARAMASAFAELAMSSRKGRDKPWRNALRLDPKRSHLKDKPLE